MTRPFHMLVKRFINTVPSSIEICIDNGVKSVLRNILGRAVKLPPAIINQPIQAAKLFKRFRDEVFDRVARSDVTLIRFFFTFRNLITI